VSGGNTDEENLLFPPSQSAKLSPVVMKLVLAFLLAFTLPVSAADSYTIQLHRPSKPGAQFRVNLDGRMKTESKQQSGDVESGDSEQWQARLKGTVKIIKVNEVGNPTELRITVDSFQLTEGKFTEEVVEKGGVLRARRVKDETEYEYLDVESGLGVPVREGNLQDALKLLFSLGGKSTDDKIFGTAQKQKLGSTWKIDPKSVAASAKEDKVVIDPKNVTGEMKITRAVKVAGKDCLEMNGQFKVTGVKPPQRFPRNLRVVKSEMTGKFFTQLPVDLKAPRLHSRSEMNMEMEVNGPGGLRVSMRRASTLISKTTPLPAKP
tara:strand:+ start:3817 stop:4779 length:963 start_codon:yes stop_codon:yes gene_type:complete